MATHLGSEFTFDGRTLSADPDDLVDLYGTVLFAADDGKNGRELWRTDGTAAARSPRLAIWA